MARARTSYAPGLFPELDTPAPVGEGPFASIALNRPVDSEFTYRVPRELAQEVAVGMRVAVPFGSRREVGIVTALSGDTDVPALKLRPLARVLDQDARSRVDWRVDGERA